MLVSSRSLFAAVLLTVSVARGARAQDPSALTPGTRFIGAWVGYSPYSPAASHLGATPGRQLGLAAIRLQWVLESAGPFALSATADLIPLAVVTHNPTYRTVDVLRPDGSIATIKTETGESPVFGAGFAPFGLQLAFARIGNARVFGAGAVGALRFTRDTPVPDSRPINVTFEYGGGVELARGDGGALVLGYKFHHLSNAYSAPKNPGLDGNVIYLGLLHRR